MIKKDIPEIPYENYIIEPSGKNTAPAIALAAAHILKRDKNAIMGIYPADHIITGSKKFEEVIKSSDKSILVLVCSLSKLFIFIM